MLGRLVPTVVEVDVLQAHRLCTATQDRQCSGVPVVAPGLECLVLLRTARLVVGPERPATTAVVACVTAVDVCQLVG